MSDKKCTCGNRDLDGCHKFDGILCYDFGDSKDRRISELEAEVAKHQQAQTGPCPWHEHENGTIKKLEKELAEQKERADSNYNSCERIKGLYSDCSNREKELLAVIAKKDEALKDIALLLECGKGRFPRYAECADRPIHTHAGIEALVVGKARKALSIPHDRTALDELLSKEREKCCEAIQKGCSACGGCGYTTETKSEHGCDGTEKDCARKCPVPVESQKQCEYCGRPIEAIKAMLSSSKKGEIK